jgi:hypothetical protein
MKNPPSWKFLCLLLVALLSSCASPKSSSSVNITNTHPNYAAPSPRTAAEEAQRQKQENFKRLQAKIPDFAIAPSSSRISGRPYISGKAIALSMDQEEKEYSLDSGLISGSDVVAESPEEVGTVFLVKTRKQRYGTYTTTSSGNIPGYVIVADLVIVDRGLGAVIYRKTFRGERPEDYVTITRYASEVVGSDPRDKVSEFLEKLPRK